METIEDVLEMYSERNEFPVLVFGSNLLGIHGGGAALYANKYYGALLGQGVGYNGNSYALPTKRTPTYDGTLSLDEIKTQVDQLIGFAKKHPELDFEVTRIGCGLAGCNDRDIIPMFKDKSNNVELPAIWHLHQFGMTSDRTYGIQVIISDTKNLDDKMAFLYSYMVKKYSEFKNLRLIVDPKSGNRLQTEISDKCKLPINYVTVPSNVKHKDLANATQIRMMHKTCEVIVLDNTRCDEIISLARESKVDVYIHNF